MGTIGNILFDVGVVLLHIDYEPAVARILPLCDPARQLTARTIFTLVNRDPVLPEYERGRISPESFYRHFAELTGYRGSIGDFADAWRLVLSENKPMTDFAMELGRTFAIYLATNTGALHTDRMFDDFPVLKRFRDRAVSFELGEVKPSRAFYEKTLAKFGVRAETCLLIDDRPENVEGAKTAGIEAVLYRNAGECMAQVRALLAARGSGRSA